MVTEVAYVLQYSHGGSPEPDWIDGGNGTADEALARKDLERCRSPKGQQLFAYPWRLVKRTTTEEVLDP